MCRDALVAEWLRRLTRNQTPSGSVGSSPTECGKTLFFCLFSQFYFKKYISFEYPMVFASSRQLAEGLGISLPLPPHTPGLVEIGY
jgi:hypothetical protein